MFISCATPFCAIVHRPIVYVMHILRVDSVHRLLSRQFQHIRATEVAAKLFWLGHTRPRSRPPIVTLAALAVGVGEIQQFTDCPISLLVEAKSFPYFHHVILYRIQSRLTNT